MSPLLMGYFVQYICRGRVKDQILACNLASDLKLWGGKESREGIPSHQGPLVTTLTCYIFISLGDSSEKKSNPELGGLIGGENGKMKASGTGYSTLDLVHSSYLQSFLVNRILL